MSNRTPDIDPDDLHDLAEQLPDLPVTAITVTPHPWWDDDRCGHCPEPETAARHAVAYVAYRRADDPNRVYRDPTCPGCLQAALVQNRQHAAVWVEIPTLPCTCDPTHGQACPVCSGDLHDAVTAGATA